MAKPSINTPAVVMSPFRIKQRLTLDDPIIDYPGGECDLRRLNKVLAELGEMTPEQALTDDRPEIRGLAKFIKRMVEEKA